VQIKKLSFIVIWLFKLGFFDIWKCADEAFGIFSPAFAATKAEKAFGFHAIRV